jgi:hypothetical protein
VRIVRAIAAPTAIIAFGLVGLYVADQSNHLGLFIVFFLVCVVGLADMMGRAADYRYLRRGCAHEGTHWLHVKEVNYYGRSFCGRQVILAIEPGWRHYYLSCGYRWWHILPVGFPAVVFNPRFWRNLVMGHRP